MHRLITLQDSLIVPLLLIIILVIATSIQRKHIDKKPYYSYYKKALFFKILMGFAFAAVYLFHYGGGDTTAYFDGTASISKMASYNFSTFLQIMGGNNSLETLSVFNSQTGYSYYLANDHTFAICRFNLLFYWLGLGSYLGNTIVLNLFLFFGVWRFFELLIHLYPNNERYFILVLFYLPSVVFWSSGLLKDGLCLTGIFFIYHFIHRIFLLKKNILRPLIWLILWSFIVMAVRPYVFYIGFGSAMVWVALGNLRLIESKFIRVLAFPVIILLVSVIGSFVISEMGQNFGSRNYSSVDAMLQQAWVIQDDLTRDYYGHNSFNIGSFDPTINGVLSKAPIAVISGMFRPFIWEVNNILMLFSALESTVIIIALLYYIFRIGFFKLFRIISKDSFVVSLFILAFIFAFVVGLTSANFGALVRYRIPVETMLMLSIVIVYISSNLSKIKDNTSAKQ